MRIITGKAKGRVIKAPEGINTRPTSDRVKESIFNILSNRFTDAIVLDLFAGTGNLGLESISRGAKCCTFIEKDKNTYKILNENINLLNFKENSHTHNQEAFSFLELSKGKKLKYDIIFLDPPYGKGLVEEAIKKINSLELLSEDGVIISEYDENDMVPESIENIVNYRTEKYGRTKVSFWSMED